MSRLFLSPGQTKALVNQLRVIDQIGQGTYATVYQVSLETNHSSRYAIKRQSINSQSSENAGVKGYVLFEINILRRLNHHPQMIQLHGIFFQGNSLNLILEYADQNLYGYIQSTSPHQRIPHARTLLLGLVKVATAMDILGYHHFDIKPENVLLNSTKDGPIFKL